MAHDKGLLSSPEYAVMCQWYEYIENNVNIRLDLIGKLILFCKLSIYNLLFNFHFIKIIFKLKSFKLHFRARKILFTLNHILINYELVILRSMYTNRYIV